MAGGLIQPYQNVARASFQFWQKPVIQASDGTLFCPGFDGPTFATDETDYVKFAITYGPYVGSAPPDRTPGVCRVRVRREYAVDKKKPVGANGARVTYHGVDLADVEIEVKIWTPEQLRQLDRLWNDLFPPAGKGTPIAFDVQHPHLSFHRILSIQLTGGEGPDIQSDRSAMFRIRALEFRQPSGKATQTNDKSVAALPSQLDPGAYPTPGSNPSNLGPR